MRAPVGAGGFYPARKERLIEEIERCFLGELGPGSLPSLGNEEIIGVMVPHAGYSYSGQIAAHSYYEVARAGLFDTYVILGTNHTGYGIPISISPEDWRTPMGEVKLDGELADKIIRKSGVADYDRYAHYAEHSIEVQLPFLQYLHSKFGKELRFVPISVGTHDMKLIRDLARGILGAIREVGRRTLIVASSDLNHVGAFYGLFPPKGKSSVEYGRELDQEILEAIISMNSEEVLRRYQERGMTVCGIGPICTLIEYSKGAGAKEAKLLKYATSYDVSGDPTVSVGYASVEFK